jgi:hypothetical protein
MSDLKPCPFCGGEATYAFTGKGWKVECDGRFGSCRINARTHYQPQKILAEYAWNTRATPTLSAAMELPEVKALVESLIAADKYIDKGHFQMARNITRAAITALAPFTEAKK